jgi:hypothetical protein
MVSEEYQYATASAYSPTLSELPLNGEPKVHILPGRPTDVY